MSKYSIQARFGWLLAGAGLVAMQTPAIASTVTTGPSVVEVAAVEAPAPVLAPPANALLASWYSTEEQPLQGTIPVHPSLTDRFWFGVGAFLATTATEIRLDSDSGIGTNLDVEDVLGLDETVVAPQGLARWRISDRWRLELEYFEVDRSHTRQTTTDIDWGDQTFPAGTQIKSEFNMSVTRLSVGYSFFKRPDKELGVALGFHLTDIDARLSSSGGNAEGGAVLAPLPVISMYGQCALTDVWAVAGRLDAFRLEYDPYKGSIYSIGVDVLCQPWRHVGFGLGYRSLMVDASAQGSDWEGRFSTNFQGPIAFISCSF